MINIVFLIYLLPFSLSYKEETCQFDFCYESDYYKEVQAFCYKSGGLMDGRCCTANDTVIGLDLQSCGIESLNITQYNFTDLIIMDLRNNSLQKFSIDELIGLFNLNFLYLPQNIKCPGGDEAWNKTLTDNNGTRCLIQQNLCQYLKINCTVTGECIQTGPGSAKCVCKPGYYGYKCMTSGEFPVTTFFTSLTASTVVLSILLWFTVGKDATKKFQFMRLSQENSFNSNVQE